MEGKTIFNKNEGDGDFDRKRGEKFCQKLNALLQWGKRWNEDESEWDWLGKHRPSWSINDGILPLFTLHHYNNNSNHGRKGVFTEISHPRCQTHHTSPILRFMLNPHQPTCIPWGYFHFESRQGKTVTAEADQSAWCWRERLLYRSSWRTSIKEASIHSFTSINGINMQK